MAYMSVTLVLNAFRWRAQRLHSAVLHTDVHFARLALYVSTYSWLAFRLYDYRTLAAARGCFSLKMLRRFAGLTDSAVSFKACVNWYADVSCRGAGGHVRYERHW